MALRRVRDGFVDRPQRYDHRQYARKLERGPRALVASQTEAEQHIIRVRTDPAFAWRGKRFV